jgi:hypothetical protein
LDDLGSETLDASLSLEHHLYAASPESTPDTQITWVQGVNHLGQKLGAGTWVLLCPKGDSGEAPQIALIQSIFRVDLAGYLHVSVLKQLHEDTDGLRYAKVSSDVAFENAGLDTLDVTVLLSSVHGGKRRFLELP